MAPGLAGGGPEAAPVLSPAAAALAAVANDAPLAGADPAAALAQLQQKRGDLAEQLKDIERQVGAPSHGQAAGVQARMARAAASGRAGAGRRPLAPELNLS